MNMFRNERGFTLIELMVVILIIGILVAIAVPVFNAARESAYESTCKANLRTIDGAVETYKASTGQAYPTDSATIQAALVPNYIKKWPACPTDKRAYVVTAGATSTQAPVITCPNLHTYP